MRRTSIPSYAFAVTLLLLCTSSPAVSQIIHVVAGSGTQDYSGDGGPATDAGLNGIMGVAADSSGNLYIADMLNNVVRRVDPGGTITTVAGNGGVGDSGDGGPAVDANLSYPQGVAVDASGNLYIADYYNYVVRRVDPGGVITTFAGTGGYGYSGDGGLAADAELSTPIRVVVHGNFLFIADNGSFRVRRVDLSTGVITTVAGFGSSSSGGDGGPAVLAGFSGILDLAVDGSGNLYILDGDSMVPFTVRKVDAFSGIITTVAGGGKVCAGDLDDPASVMLGNPYYPVGAIAADAGGNLYIASGCIVRRLDAATGQLVRCAGSYPCGFSGDGGPALDARLGNDPEVTFFTHLLGLAADPGGGLYISDQGNLRVWKVDDPGGIFPPMPTPTVTPSLSDPGPGLSILKSVDPAEARPGDTLTFCVTLRSPPASAKVDIVWLLDRTGSMMGVIDAIKANIVDFTSQLASSGVDHRLGLVTFVDDEPTPLTNYGFAASDAMFQSWVNGIPYDGDGGDAQENALEAIMEADALPWRPDAARVMILVTDAPVKIDGTGGLHTIPQVLSALAPSGTVIHAVCYNMCECGGQNPVDLVLGTGGLWFPLESSDWSDLLDKLARSVAAFTGVILRDALPGVLEPVPGSYPGATWTGSELVWGLRDLSRGATVTYCFSSRVTAPFDPYLTNSACVTADGRTEVCSDAVTVVALETFTPTDTPTFTLSPTPTPTPTVTLSPTPTLTPTWTPTFTPSPTPTDTLSPTVTFTPTITPTPTPREDLNVWPDPFVPQEAVRGTLKFAVLPVGSQVALYSVSGEKVRELSESNRRVEWDARNGKGRPCASGTYYYIVRTGDRILLKGKIILVNR